MVKLVAFALLCVSMTHAETIVSTFGPGQSFQPPPGIVIGGGVLRNDPPANAGVTQAFEFTPPTTSQLSQVDLALRYIFLAGRATGPASLDITIASDDLGQPGAAVETIALNNVLGGVPLQPGVVTATSLAQPSLVAGTPYWLVVAPPDLLNTAFDWLISPINPLPTDSASRLGSGAWVTGVATQPLAFDVIGTAAVPEPCSLLLAGAGLALIVFRQCALHT